MEHHLPIPSSSTAKPQTFSDTVELYLNNLRVRNYSPQTVQSQTKQLRYFRLFCEKAGRNNAGSVCRDTVLEYQTHLHQYQKRNGGVLAASTQRQWLPAVTGFFGWLMKHRVIQHNPATDLEMPSAEFRLPKAVLTSREVERVLGVPDIDTPFDLRDRAIMMKSPGKTLVRRKSSPPDDRITSFPIIRNNR
jgi:integrase/recombinase XerD